MPTVELFIWANLYFLGLNPDQIQTNKYRECHVKRIRSQKSLFTFLKKQMTAKLLKNVSRILFTIFVITTAHIYKTNYICILLKDK